MSLNRPDYGLRPQDTDRLWDDDPEGPETFQEAAQAFHEALVGLWEVTGLPVAQAAADKIQAGVDTWRDWWKPMDWSGPLTAHWPETWVQRISRLAGDSLRAIWAGVATPFQTTLRNVMIEETKAKAKAAGFDIEGDVQDRIRAGEEPVQAWVAALQYAQVARAMIHGDGLARPSGIQGMRPFGLIVDEAVPPGKYGIISTGLTPEQMARHRAEIPFPQAETNRAFQDSRTGEWMTDDEVDEA